MIRSSHRAHRWPLALILAATAFLASPVQRADGQYALSCMHRCVTEAGLLLVEDGQTYYLYNCVTNADTSVICYYR